MEHEVLKILREISSKLDVVISHHKAETAPMEALEIKQLAREISNGNMGALKDYNRRHKAK